MRIFTGFLVFMAALAAAAPASASQLIDRSASNVKLLVAKNGVAQISYSAGGKQKQVLAWGALNAATPTHAGATQQLFTINYANGHGTPYEGLGRASRTRARRTTAPLSSGSSPRARLRTARYWVAQSWQRNLNDWGQARPGPGSSGSSGSRTSAASCRCSTSTRTGRTPGGSSTSSAISPTRASRSTASRRTGSARPSTSSAC